MTVIAAGFDSGQLPYKKVDIRREPAAALARPAAVRRPAPSRASRRARRAAGTAAAGGRGAHAGQPRRRPRRPGLPQVLTVRRTSTARASTESTTTARPSWSVRSAPSAARIADACEAVGRDPRTVTLIAVTKTYPASDVAALAELGVLDIGESQDQEARAKVAELAAARPAPAAALAPRRPAADQQGRAASSGYAARRALGRPRRAGQRAGRRGGATRSAPIRWTSSSRSASTATPTAAACSTPTSTQLADAVAARRRARACAA